MTDAAYQACLRLARDHYENFPVASWMLPPGARPHIAAIYAFARAADDFADEGTRTPAARLALLDDWRRRLYEAASVSPASDGVGESDIFVALARTMREFRLDVRLFNDLLSAFAQDVTVSRYDTWDDLLDYSRRSANPVGRLVLQVCGYRDAGLDQLSDRVCTALQLANFWQDLERDWAKGRLYVPREVLAAAGAREDDLNLGRLSPEWRAALTDVVRRTRGMFQEGRAVADGVRGRLRWELRATWLGGMRILDQLEAVNFDVFNRRPALGLTDKMRIGVRMLTWRADAPAA